MNSFLSLVKPQLGSALIIALAAGFLASCSTLPSSGPNRKETVQVEASPVLPIQVVDIDDATARRVLAADKRTRFADIFSGGGSPGFRVGAGDLLEVSIWEAPPATLFGTTAFDPRQGPTTTRVTTFPEQMVSHKGTINVPFAGMVPVAGTTTQQIEAEIARRLQGKANQPQVMVRVTKNATSNVTVVGEVAQSLRMPLTDKGERLLDSIAAAGGVRQPVGKMTLQLTRGEIVQTMPLDAVIQDPKQNVFLQPGDVVTALFQPHSFTALGATGKNEEIPFEAQGISLAQALARSGGVLDQRADARGVFVFRFEDPAAVDNAEAKAQMTPDGKVPVVYRIDLKDPRSFFVAQSFPVRNRDVMYVSNASAAELQKFMNILTSIVFTATGLGTMTR